MEGDLQIGMRVLLNSDDEVLIEKDSQFLKANFGSRKNFLIASVTLQKRLTLDNSLISMKHTIYTITNLQSFYDRQLLHAGSIADESTSRN